MDLLIPIISPRDRRLLARLSLDSPFSIGGWSLWFTITKLVISPKSLGTITGLNDRVENKLHIWKHAFLSRLIHPFRLFSIWYVRIGCLFLILLFLSGRYRHFVFSWVWNDIYSLLGYLASIMFSINSPLNYKKTNFNMFIKFHILLIPKFFMYEGVSCLGKTKNLDLGNVANAQVTDS